MIALTNHLWQSTLFAAVAGLLTLLLRKNHARARYWIWLAASAKFLIPFALLVAAGTQMGWRAIPSQKAPQLVVAIEQFSQPFSASNSTARAAAAPNASLIPGLLLAGWACGFVAVVFFWLTRFQRIRAVVRAAVPLDLDAPLAVRLSPALQEPGVFGIFRPVLLLPGGILERLAPEQLHAILAHEWTHVRRRDNLTAALHMFVEALFWFHPLVWWIGARLVEERERACDEAVFSEGHEPQAYAEGILKVCEYCLEAPLLCVSGVGGSDLKKRIQRIMAGRVAHDLGRPGRLLLAVAGVAAIAVPIGIGILNAPARAQSQLATPSAPQFEVASIKPAAPDQRGMFTRTDPGGRVNISNMPLKEMMVLAWRVQSYQISGGPSWIESARYDISAKAENNPKQDELPLMFQALLTERFRLKIHHETKELPIYALVLANKDSKLGPQLTESKEGSCTPFDPSRPPPPPEPGKPRTLGCGGIMMGPAGLTVTSAPIDQMTPVLSRILGRTVVDQTGLKGKFDMRLEYTPDASQALQPPPGGLPPGAPQPPPVDPNGPSIFTALQEQLGLKLESQKGPVDMIVIDHVERPTEN